MSFPKLKMIIESLAQDLTCGWVGGKFYCLHCTPRLKKYDFDILCTDLLDLFGVPL